MFARMRARVKTAAPFPRIGVVGIAGALGNRADMNIAVVNVPALSVVFGSVAGEFGHGPSLLRLARVWSGGPRALQDSHLLNTTKRRLRTLRAFDGRRLRLAGLPLPLAGVNQVCEAVADQNLLISRSAANCASASGREVIWCHDLRSSKGDANEASQNRRTPRAHQSSGEYTACASPFSHIGLERRS
jgi:hypothetical protein